MCVYMYIFNLQPFSDSVFFSILHKNSTQIIPSNLFYFSVSHWHSFTVLTLYLFDIDKCWIKSLPLSEA